MNRIFNYIKKFTLLFLITFFVSCDQLKTVDKSIRKVFSQVNRFERKKNNYANRFKSNKKKDGEKDSKESEINSILQKNIINNHGYKFEIINGVDPGTLISYKSGDSTIQVFLKSDQIYKGIDDNIEVFGWHPYWMKDKWKNYPFELLSTVSYFSYKIDPISGNNQNPEQLDEWINSEFVEVAQSKNTKVLLTISCQGQKNTSKFLNNSLAWQQVFMKVTKLILDKNADGIDINFENISLKNRKLFVDFVKQFDQYLSDAFYRINKKHFISLTLPASSGKESYDINKISPHVNLFTIMGYDYHSYDVPSPTAPLQSEDGGYSLLSTLDYYKDIGIDMNKTILAFPHYGILWNIEQIGEDKNIKASIERKLTYDEINKFFLEDPNNKYQIELDPISMTKNFSMIFEDYSIKEIYFDDSFTLSKKYEFAMNSDLKGIGVWALGYDDGRTDLWNIIDEMFSSNDRVFNDPIAEVNGFPIRFAKKLVQNKDVFIAIIISLLISLIVSFVILISDTNVRDRLTQSKINIFILILFSFIFLIPLVVLVNESVQTIGFYIKSDLQIYIGFFIGIITCIIGTKITIKKQEKP